MRTNNLIALLTIGSIFIGCEAQVQSNSECVLDYEAALEEYNRQLDAQEITEETPPPVACQLPEQDPEAGLSIDIKMRDFTQEQEEKMLKAVERIKIAINSTKFKEKILNHKYKDEFTFVDNAGLSNEEIYKKIMEGAEILTPELDYEIDVDVTMYYKRSSTVGYTYPNTTRTWVNSRFFNNYTLGEVASNVVHEWTHKLGFEHDFNNNSARPYSVPYAVGEIIEEIIEEM